MSIRQDQAQLIITIDAKESVEYQKAVQRSAELTRNIKKMEVGTDEYNAALREQAEISKRLGQTDYTKLSIKNLTDRKRALQEQIRILPQAQAAELGLERELQRVNSALAEQSRRTRAVGQEMQKVSPIATGFGANFRKGLAFLAPLGIIEGIRQIGGALFGLAKDSITAFDGAAKAEAQLEAAIKSTGGAAGKSVQELVKQSSELQKLTLYSDDQIQEAQGLLLTFTKVGGSIYDQAIPAITDMATSLKTDLSTASIQVGKALNDPVKGVTALSKAGVQFTADQKATIKTLVETGDVAGAQTVILKELETQFKGSAKAAADAGLGPFQKFKNRIDDIQEGIGLLISNVLSFLGPVLDNVATFAEKFVGVLVSGDKATGEFSTSVNFLVGLLRIVYDTISFVVNALGFWYDQQVKLFNILKELPVIGGIVKAFAATFDFIIDAVTNTTAVFAGLKAAIQQTFDNAANYLKSTLLSLKIFAKEAELLFTINGRDQVKAEIKQLESLKADYAKAGKTVGQAYKDAYNEVIKKEAQETKAKAIVNNGVFGGSTKTGATGTTSTDKKSKKENQYSEAPKTLTVPTLSQVDIDLREKTLLDMLAREQALLEESYLQGKVSQEEYELEKLRNLSASLATRIELYDAFGQKESAERRALNIEMLKVDKEIVEKRAQIIKDSENLQLSELQEMFLAKLITEEEYNMKSLKLKINHAEAVLAQMKKEGLEQTEAYKKQQEELLGLKKQYNDDKNAKDFTSAMEGVDSYEKAMKLWSEAQDAFDAGQIDKAKFKEIKLKAISEASKANIQDSFDFLVDILSKDEAARKKNADLIKAFESGKVLVNSVAEISSIWKTTAELGPIGWALGAIRTALVVGRAGLAISKINAQQFYDSGKVKPYNLKGSQKISVVPNIPTQEGGDNVLAVVKPGEVVLNKRHQEMAGGDAFFAKLGVPGFADSGVVRLPNTNPTGLTSSILSRNQATQVAAATSDPRIEMLAASLDRLTEMMPAALSNISAKVSYFDIKSKDDELNEIKQLARY